jgi:broad specificity phosphatase PhoE
MSRVLLVRHAQASFLEQNYDKLSPLGERQARLLGKYWARHRVSFDRTYSGPCVRQRDTARIVREAYRDAGLSFPEPIVFREFDEYQGEAVLQHALPQLVETDATIRELHQQFLDVRKPAEHSRPFQKVFEAVIRKWVGGDISVPGVESWTEFCARVNSGLSRFLSGAKHGEQAAILCSGGPIAVAVERALNLSAQDTLRVAWMSRNCSYSEFIYSGERFTLSAFNSFPHLDDPSLLTYR